MPYSIWEEGKKFGAFAAYTVLLLAFVAFVAFVLVESEAYFVHTMCPAHPPCTDRVPLPPMSKFVIQICRLKMGPAEIWHGGMFVSFVWCGGLLIEGRGGDEKSSCSRW